MIGFNALGRMGRLGNQMFQYAALKGIARNIGADITIPIPSRMQWMMVLGTCSARSYLIPSILNTNVGLSEWWKINL